MKQTPLDRFVACLRSCAAAALLAGITGCSEGVLSPHGSVGEQEKTILLNSLGIMLAIVIPTILAIFAVAWWFRSSNKTAHYRPDWEYSGRVEMIVWAIPAMVILLLGGIAWVGSHDLDPPKALASEEKAVEVEVVSLDWKWLFIYPGEGVASINKLVVPAGVPVSFRLTSGSVMNSFFVPELGTQIYTMSGMISRLNLVADQKGSYAGLSAQFSGDGFSGMHFTVDAVSKDQFTEWVSATKDKGKSLAMTDYGALSAPSSNVAPVTYGSVEAGLFDHIVKAQSGYSAGEH